MPVTTSNSMDVKIWERFYNTSFCFGVLNPRVSLPREGGDVRSKIILVSLPMDRTCQVHAQSRTRGFNRERGLMILILQSRSEFRFRAQARQISYTQGDASPVSHIAITTPDAASKIPSASPRHISCSQRKELPHSRGSEGSSTTFITPM